MNDRSPVLDRLRAATAPLHRELEDRLRVVDRLASLPGRRAMVPRYYRMHESAERAAWPWLKDIADLEVEARDRVAVLSKDLDALAIQTPEAAAFHPLGGVAEALGVLYVLEGSTLGGRMIRKSIEARGCDLTGLTFLDPYGSRTGARWRDFLRVLEREAGRDIEGAERGAVGGFEHAWRCLLDAVGVDDV